MGVLLAAAVAFGTLHGVVMRGPTTPVCRVGVPCSAPAVGAVLLFQRAGHAAVRVTAGAKGRYSVRLPAGVYAVRLASKPRLGMSIRPTKVHVVDGASLRLDFDVDTGIR